MPILQMLIKKYGVYLLSFLKEWFVDAIKIAHKNATIKAGGVEDSPKRDSLFFIKLVGVDHKRHMDQLMIFMDEVLTQLRLKGYQGRVVLTSDMRIYKKKIHIRAYTGKIKLPASDTPFRISANDKVLRSLKGAKEEFIIYDGDIYK